MIVWSSLVARAFHLTGLGLAWGASKCFRASMAISRRSIEEQLGVR